MENLIFSKNYKVHVYETNPAGKLSLHSLFNYLQDAASEHAGLLGFGRDDLLKDNSIWVLSRIYVEIKRLPVWNEICEVSTWPSGIDSVFALRNYEVSAPDGIIIRGSSSWLIIDKETRKIHRPGYLEKFEFPVRGNNIRNSTKLTFKGEQAVTDHCFRIKASDLDVNLHTNNAAYLRWITDSYDLRFMMENDPLSIEINYLAETMYGDEISLGTSSINSTYNHSIFRKDDMKEICRLRIEWDQAVKNNL